MRDVCLDMGHLSCATILLSDPLLPVSGVHSFGLLSLTEVEGREAKQPSEWGHCFPSFLYHAVLNSTSWVIVKLSKLSEQPITHCCAPEQGCITMDTCVCICVCDQNILPPGSQIEVSYLASDSIWAGSNEGLLFVLLTESPSVCFKWLISCSGWEKLCLLTLESYCKLFRISYCFIIAFFLPSVTTLFSALFASLFSLLLSFFRSFNQNVLAWKTLRRKIPHILEGSLVAFHLTWKIQTTALLEDLWWLSLLCFFPSTPLIRKNRRTNVWNVHLLLSGYRKGCHG